MSQQTIRYNPEFRVIAEADDYIVVDKPAHLLVHPSKPNNPPTLADGLRELLAYEMANGGQISIINRLDRDTSGLVLVAKTSQSAREFSIAMQARRFAKEYAALVWGWPEEDTFASIDPILRKIDLMPSPIYIKQMVHEDGATAQTEFQVLRRFERATSNGHRFALVRARPISGRMHQIRLHLSHLGFPVVGDKMYGPDERCYLNFIEEGWTPALQAQLLLPRHALHSIGLQLRSAEDENTLLHDWRSELPEDFVEFMT